MGDVLSSQVQDSSDSAALMFRAEVSTLTLEEDKSNNFCHLNLTLSSEADITIMGKVRNQDTYTFTHADTLSARSFEFVHDYEVQKFGDSPIERVLIVVEFPYEWNGIDFLRIYQPEGFHMNQPLTCSSNAPNAYLTDSLADETDSISRAKRSSERSSSEAMDLQHQQENQAVLLNCSTPDVKCNTVSEMSSSEAMAFQQQQENQVVLLNCSTPDVKCNTVTCVSRPFQDNSALRLSIRMAVDISRIAPLLGSKNVIQLSSQGQVKIELPRNFRQTHKFNNKSDIAIVETRFIGSPGKEEIAGWVIPVSVGGGLLLLFLLIVTLIKAGFFQRKKKLELEERIEADNEEKEMVRRSQMMDCDFDVNISG